MKKRIKINELNQGVDENIPKVCLNCRIARTNCKVGRQILRIGSLSNNERNEKIGIIRSCMLLLTVFLTLSVGAQSLHLEHGSPVYDRGYLMIGYENTLKPKAIFIDEENIQARANGNAKTLFLNEELGGDVLIGNFNSTISTQGRFRIGNLNKQMGLHIVFGNDLNLTSGGFMMLGQTNGRNIVMDDNEIQARYNGQPSNLVLNNDGGSLFCGGLRDIGDKNNMQYNATTGEIGFDNSSRRYKSNITTLVDDWSKILRARPVRYDRPHSAGDWEYGYIAEEMDSIGLSNLVYYDQLDRPENFNYRKMVVYITEMIKLQQQAIANLELQLKVLRDSKKTGLGQTEVAIRSNADTAEMEALEFIHQH